MRILLVHQNFPGQFKHLAPALAQRGHDVRALIPSTNTHPSPIPTLKYRWQETAFDVAALRLAKTYREMTHRGEVVARAAEELDRKLGFTPDVVFGNPGWGETLFLREVWPNARHLLYGEFFYRARGLDTGFDPEFSSNELASRIWVTARQGHLLLALNSADAILVPTRWQAQSFPSYIQDRITVVHDGIDTAKVAPATGALEVEIPGTGLRFRKGDEVLTFVNRTLEPYRGFHIFMRALPRILAERPNAQVVLVGGDGASYGPPPPGQLTWREIMLKEVGARLDLARVHFVGRVQYPVFLDLMRVSRAHAYLTYPFVLSWSMLEAMSAGALVVGSRTPPVEEVIEDGVNGRLVDFFDVEGWSKTLTDALANPERYAPLREAARKTVLDRYDLATTCFPRLLDFVERTPQG